MFCDSSLRPLAPPVFGLMPAGIVNEICFDPRDIGVSIDLL
jgi:hypothetical protein